MSSLITRHKKLLLSHLFLQEQVLQERLVAAAGLSLHGRMSMGGGCGNATAILARQRHALPEHLCFRLLLFFE